MAHLVLDTLVAHQLELNISAAVIAERQSEWNRVLTARTRSEVVKSVAKFCGLDLLTYAHANMHRDLKGNFTVKCYSDQWLIRQPA